MQTLLRHTRVVCKTSDRNNTRDGVIQPFHESMENYESGSSCVRPLLVLPVALETVDIIYINHSNRTLYLSYIWKTK